MSRDRTTCRVKDYDIGMLVLVANGQYKLASWRIRICAWLFGKHQIFTHLDCRLHISFYREVPYILTIYGVSK